MHRLYPTFSLTLLLCLFLGTCGRAQVLLEQNFATENTLPFTASPTTYGNNTDDQVWAVVTSLGTIMPPAGSTAFWGGQDLVNTSGGTASGGKSILTFSVDQICDVTAPTFSFAYNVVGFDGGDDFGYTLTVDGVAQADVILIDGRNGGGVSSMGWETVNLAIPAGSITATLEIFAIQNGTADQLGIGNVSFTGGGDFGNCGTVCGIGSFGPAVVLCTSESTDSRVDAFTLEIPYTGMDAGVSLLVEAGATTPANDVTATTTIGGDLPTATADGTITLSSTAGEFIEGDEVRVSLTGGNCSFVLEISTTDNQCSNPCNINLRSADTRYFCSDFTTGTDGAFAFLPFTGGPEPGYTVTIDNGATVRLSEGDPASESRGNILLEGLVEGGSYLVTTGGGGCPTEMVMLTVPTNFCTPPVLVINEVLADPGTDDTVNDTNGNSNTATEDEFVELYNPAENPVDVSGFTLEDGFDIRYIFPDGTVIPGRTAFVIIGSPTGNSLPCPTNTSVEGNGLGLTNDGDVVALRRTDGTIVHNMRYGAEAETDQSVALAVDGDITSGYVQHTTLTPSDPISSSPCISNPDPSLVLPVTLTAFTAVDLRKTVQLEWRTAGEIASDRFVIERSRAGQHWLSLGSVPAAGTAADYRFQDEHPMSGLSYYRLRQIDLDGSYALFGPVAVTRTEGTLAVVPNPVTDRLQLSRSLSPGSVLTLIDNSGRMVRRLVPTESVHRIGSLPAGVYYLRIVEADAVQTLRFVRR